jgi:hypothetical protein
MNSVRRQREPRAAPKGPPGETLTDSGIIDILENPDQPDRSCLHLGNQESPAPPAPPGRPGDLEDRQVPCREGPPQHPRPSPPRPSFTTFRRWGVTELGEPGWGGLLPLRRYFRPQGTAGPHWEVTPADTGAKPHTQPHRPRISLNNPASPEPSESESPPLIFPRSPGPRAAPQPPLLPPPLS